jgi:D-alanine-D-alanine ligase-like ATP-grasp enzyme
MVILSSVYIMKNTIIYIIVLILITCLMYYKKTTVIKEGFVLCDIYQDYCKKNNITVNKKNKTVSRNGTTVDYRVETLNDTHYPCNQKHLTSSILRENNIPVPKFYVWDNKQTNLNNIKNINKNISFPLVVKPTNGQQGHGVKTNIKNNDDLNKHVQFLLSTISKKNNIIIEQQISGSEFRVTVYNGDIIGIDKKNSPYVIGNNKNTLSELIDEHKHSVYKPYNIDTKLLRKQNVNLETIIPANKKIILSRINNISNGANPTNIPLNMVHVDNIYMFKQINQIFKKNITGIDYISENLSLPYYHTGAVIEINTQPGVTSHTRDSNYDEIQEYLNTFFRKLFG